MFQWKARLATVTVFAVAVAALSGYWDWLSWGW
jgi:hypothetical protein